MNEDLPISLFLSRQFPVFLVWTKIFNQLISSFLENDTLFWNKNVLFLGKEFNSLLP